MRRGESKSRVVHSGRLVFADAPEARKSPRQPEQCPCGCGMSQSHPQSVLRAFVGKRGWVPVSVVQGQRSLGVFFPGGRKERQKDRKSRSGLDAFDARCTEDMVVPHRASRATMSKQSP